jgi:hypothetical protein
VTFEGNGSAVCLWVGPELAHWAQAVANQAPTPEFSYPDNVFDDGDIDLEAGLSVYYNGSPGEVFGDFSVRYEDSLGNVVPVELNECRILAYGGDPDGHSGRGRPEYCSISNTAEGVSYTVAMEVFSTPIDDNRLGFGVLLVDGSCRSTLESQAFESIEDECMIRGEALMPLDDHDYRTDPIRGVGYDTIKDAIYPGAVEFETAFCNSASGESDETRNDLLKYCEEEATLRDCNTERCFCGDPSDNPTGGSI